MNPRFAITGANGFLGSRFAQYAGNCGADIIALGRRPPESPVCGFRFVEYHLAKPPPTEMVFSGCTAVIHCAYELSTDPRAMDRNITAALAVRNAARAVGARFIFVSSMSAHAEAESIYGKSKWAIEQALNPGEDSIIKPGIIIGNGGLYSRLKTSLARLPFVPLFYGGLHPIQPISVDDLMPAFWEVATRNHPGVWPLGVPEPLTLEDFYRRILTSMGHSARMLRIPGAPALAFLRVMESLRIKLPVNSDNLLGLKHLKAFDVRESIRDLRVVLTPLDQFPWV